MAGDLYSRLFRYRSREGRATLEDFLTEALADFLNRAPREITTGLVSSWLNAEGNAAWSLLTREGAEIAWTTQGVLLRGRARFDLMLSVGGRAAVIVESKVGSGIRVHSEMNDPALGSNQLQTYGRWLADQRRGLAWPGALILIDYAPVPPPDFDDGRGYGGVDRSAVAWSTVARFIKHSLRSADTSLAWVQLGQDLNRFMEAQGMPSDTFNSRDVAVFQLYLDGVKARLEATTSALWESLRGTAVFEHSGKSDDEDSMPGGCHWQWAYLTEPVAPSTGKWYFAFGIPLSGSVHVVEGCRIRRWTSAVRRRQRRFQACSAGEPARPT